MSVSRMSTENRTPTTTQTGSSSPTKRRNWSWKKSRDVLYVPRDDRRDYSKRLNRTITKQTPHSDPKKNRHESIRKIFVLANKSITLDVLIPRQAPQQRF